MLVVVLSVIAPVAVSVVNVPAAAVLLPIVMLLIEPAVPDDIVIVPAPVVVYDWLFVVVLKVIAVVAITAPVDTPPMVIVPEPLAFSVRFSFVPDEIADRATPPPAAADLMLKPVAAEVVEASTLNDGFVVPAGPTARAFADVEVIVKPVRLRVLDQEGAADAPPETNTCPDVP